MSVFLRILFLTFFISYSPLGHTQFEGPGVTLDADGNMPNEATPAQGRGGRRTARPQRQATPARQRSQQNQRSQQANAPSCSAEECAEIGTVGPFPLSIEAKAKCCEQRARNGSAANSNQPENPIEKAVATCEDESHDAETQCMTEPDEGTSGLASGADQLSQGLGAAGICGQLGSAINAASTAIVGVKANCALEQSQCTSTCGEAQKAIRKAPAQQQALYQFRLTEARKACVRAATRLRGLEQQVAGLASRQQSTTNCQNDASNATAEAQQALLEKCRANPSLLECSNVLAQDCSNPEIARKNLTCICQSNSSDPRCGYKSKLGGVTSIGNGLDGTSGSGTTGGGAAAGSEFDPGGNTGMNDSASGSKPGPAWTSFQPGGGGGGGGAGGGGSGANSPPEKPGAAGRKSLNTNVNAGFRGGGSGGPGFSGGSQGGAGGAGYGPSRTAANSNGQVDLKRFLPGDPEGIRGRSGSTGPDGITGPFSSNWRKVNNRYEAIRTSLRP